MKRALCLVCAAMLLLLCACGAGGQSATADPTPTVSESPTPSASAPATAPVEEQTPPPDEDPAEEAGSVSPLTGLPMDEALVDQKPVAIMLNNIKAAMPQQGNSQADIIYEVLAEGGITRMLGIYQDVSQLGTVGSVRSARLYFLELALGHDAIYVHAGGSPEFYDTKEARGLETIDGVNGYYSYANTGLFWRDRTRIEGNYYAYEHSLITSGEKLTQILTARGVFDSHRASYENPLVFAEVSAAAPTEGEATESLTVTFSNYKSTTFRYDEESSLYRVEQYGEAYIDGNDGSQISVTNVIVLRAPCTVVDDAGRLSIDLTSGEGWFACGGFLCPITWEKGDADQPLRCYDSSGQPLVLGAGKSYICIIPLSRTLTGVPAQSN